MGIWNGILTGLGALLRFIYEYLAFENYGLAIIIFTILTKLLLLPLTMKQMKSTSKMQELQPELQKLQKMYANNKEKLNEEMMKLYQKHNYNPASGCLPLLIQFPILIALYRVLIKPLTYMYKIPEYIAAGIPGKEAVTKATETIGKLANFANISTTDYSNEIGIIEFFSKNPGDLSKVSDLLSPNEVLNMNFLGLNLGKKPVLNTSMLFGPEMGTYLPLLIIPIVATVLTFYSQRIQLGATQKKADTAGSKDGADNMQNSLKWMGPIMTLYFSFILPAGMGLYWISTYVLQIVQQLFVNYKMEQKQAEAKGKVIEKKMSQKKENIIEGKGIEIEQKEEDQKK
jgi:YidC/Oxa1 family membrane protein insertase